MVEVEVASHSPIATMSRKDHLSRTFEAYRAEIDSDNERRERLIILSRSITQLSKKLIFHLHRGATSSPGARAKMLNDARTKEREIREQFRKVNEVLREDGDDKGWRWHRQVSPGLEEYIESLSFLHYLEGKGLITLSDVQAALSDQETGDAWLVVTPEDYVLGISDLTGELMRYATNALSTGDHETPLSVCQFVRDVKASKQKETTRSLEKIERVCYALRLRLLEFADRPEILRQMAKRALDEADREEID
ncbi:hypothetical protein TREMEDRAFT_35613 [Tremella mesenterica DSM 1558]|uniref:uncharacterized protein n=1 Tax=Tremella mesenterica (strain ATCC 24925 / CBS 8224 / DSM 1558 / NBRC 9311 / NRRL Y-6157 / RJB 2259-6 / UBC 559-6) TaxID=578456 RepID=UPI00032BCAF8|nr:uncharacterized protein TREMEDRAFT_35613 [Tremella mesenterica DSM 1558]EIW66050.1 hypothetical protein TREMEDRAFT_35613 [Tremella mesenterica DSM 1558]